MAAFQWVKHQTPLSHLSPSFILPEEFRHKLSQASALTSIPVIDLTEVQGEGPFAPSLVEKVSRACEEYGFFQIINHGVSDEVCARMFDAIKQLFEMPPLRELYHVLDFPLLVARNVARFPNSSNSETFILAIDGP